MFSTAFDTMKFLSLTNPIIGFSSFLGTGTLLKDVDLSNLETAIGYFFPQSANQ
jgi:hypothetical protein